MLPVGSDPLLHRHTPKTVPLCNRLIALLPRLVTLHYGQFELFIVLRHERFPSGWSGVQLWGCSSSAGRQALGRWVYGSYYAVPGATDAAIVSPSIAHRGGAPCHVDTDGLLA